MEIKDIAYIRSGLFAKPSSDGELAYLQVNHFDGDGSIKRFPKPELSQRQLNPHHLLKPGDVLLSSKGHKNFAAVIDYSFPESVASTSFLVIRLRNKSVLPEYLSWYLNSSNAQNLLKQGSLGTSIQSISKTALENLVIPIPTIEVQARIIDLDGLSKKAKYIWKEITRLQHTLIENQIFNSLKQYT